VAEGTQGGRCGKGVSSSAGSFAGIGGQEINDVIFTSNHWILINE